MSDNDTMKPFMTILASGKSLTKQEAGDAFKAILSGENKVDKFIFIDVKVTPNFDSDKRFEEARVIIYYKPKRISIRELREQQ